MSQLRSGFFVAVLAAVMGVIVSRASAQIIEADPIFYSFHPRSAMSLGVGFTPNDVARPKIRCIEAASLPLEPGALFTQFSTTLVTNSEQLRQALSIDAKIDASYLSFGGGANFSFSDSSAFSSDAITVIISATTEFGRIALGPPKLTPTAAAVLKDGAKFANTCGTRFVQIEHRGAAVYTIVTLSSVTNEDQSAIKAGLAAHGGWGPLNGSAATNFQNELSRAAHSGRLSVQVVATGGSGFGSLSDLIVAASTKSNSLDEIKKALGNFLKDFKAENAAPIGYQVASMELLGWNPSSVNLWNEYKERKLRTIVAIYRHETTTIDQINSIISDAHPDPRAALMSKEAIAALKAALPKLEEYQRALALAHTSCKADVSSAGDKCKLPERPTASIDALPSIPDPPASVWTVITDAGPLDPIQSRAIIEVQPFSPLLPRARIYKQAATSARLVLKINGHYLSAASLKARADDAKVTLDSLPITSNGAQYTFWDSSIDWLPFGCPLPSSAQAEWNHFVEANLRHGPKERVAILFYDVADQFGRHFPIDVCSFSMAQGWGNPITGSP
jgi:hypothetical protein